MIFAAFGKALSQIGDPRFRGVLLRGIALTLALLIGATAGFVWFVSSLLPEELTLPFIGEITWINDVVSWGAVLVMLVLSTFLMVPVASAITSFFLDEVAEAVEERHYPHLPTPDRVPFGDAFRDTVNFLGVIVAANVLALVLYLFLNVAAPLIFWALNGYLLGREYFTMVAIRWLGRVEAKRLRSEHAGTVWLAGVLMAIPLSVPILNLVIPILGAATFTHLYHDLTSQRRQTSARPHQR